MKKTNKKRGLASIVAVAIAFAMVLTGTFAWQSISQQALNQAVARPWVAGGRLHDNFEHLGTNFGENQWLAGTTANKDIFVENFSERIDADGVQPGQNIFVRVRLHEFLQFGEGAADHPTQDGQTWPAEQAGVTTITGSLSPVREDVTTWSFRTPNGNNSGAPEFERYWNWGFGQAGDQKWYMPTFNIDPDSRASDVTGAAIDPQAHLDTNPNPTAANPNANTTDPTDVATYRTGGYPLEAGDEGFWQQGDTWSAVQKVEGGNVTPNPVQQEARQTLELEFPWITMTEWLDGVPELGIAPQTAGNFWVWDYDGWFYWANPLPAGQATGLLLSNVTLNQTPNDEMYYAIFVDAEMATANYWETSFTGVLSDGAAILMNLISDRTGDGTGGGSDGTAAIRNTIRNTEINDTFQAGDVTWRVLAQDGEYRLVLTEHVHLVGPSVEYNLENIFTTLSNSHLRGHINTWGAENLIPAMRAIAVEPVGVDTDVRSEPGGPAPGQPAQIGWENGPAGHTSPGGFATPAGAPAALFILSRSEINEFFRYTGGSGGNANGESADPVRRATDVEGVARPWWSRTPGVNDESPTTIVAAGGGHSGAPATSVAGIRPALWVWVG